MPLPRRVFLSHAAALAATALAPRGLSLGKEPNVNGEQATKSEEEISAPEDLMREHGVLNRVLLIYEEGVRRLTSGEETPPEVFQRSARLVRRFVEDYHEQLEQNFIFPQFEKRGELLDLVRVLRQQHDAGRKLTDAIQRASAPDQYAKAAVRGDLIRTCAAFCRMYRPHEAREDTVLFPALYKIVPAAEVHELGEQFEREEHKLFGEEGFQKTVEEVAEIEKQLGIYELANFTPK